ncbi:MAG: hypothetical protein K5660_04110 [Paludibacteraceae bacterium]|nr:hypothetical protein [Paludibacteraceae bacterium]
MDEAHILYKRLLGSRSEYNSDTMDKEHILYKRLLGSRVGISTQYAATIKAHRAFMPT